MKRHIARLTTGQRCLVVFMQIPEDPEHALVVFTDNLPHKYETVLLPAAESAEGQQEETLANLLNRRPMIDGRHSVLRALHEDGMLKRIPIDQIVMMPRPNMTFPLRQVLTQMGRMGNMQPFDMTQAAGYQAPPYAQPPAQTPPYPQPPVQTFQPPYPSSGNIPLNEAQKAIIPPGGYPKFDTKILGEPETIGVAPPAPPPPPPVYPQAAYPQAAYQPPQSPFDVARFNAQNHNRAVQAMTENVNAAVVRLRQAEMMEAEAAKMRAEAVRMAPSLFTGTQTPAAPTNVSPDPSDVMVSSPVERSTVYLNVDGLQPGEVNGFIERVKDEFASSRPEPEQPDLFGDDRSAAAT